MLKFISQSTINCIQLRSLYHNPIKGTKAKSHTTRSRTLLEKHYMIQSKSPENDWKWKACQNGVQLIKWYLNKKCRQIYFAKWPHIHWCDLSYALWSKFSSCEENLEHAQKKLLVAYVCKELEKEESLTYYQWSYSQKSCKIQNKMSGEEINILLAEKTLMWKMKMLKYIYCQFSVSG